MCVRVIFFIVIFIFIITTLTRINNNNKEKFNDNELYFDGSVHLKGGININNKPNKLKVKSLCFQKEVNGQIKEECLDSGQFSFAINNTPDRKYFKCLGGTCIDNNHLDILKNKKNFKLKNLNTNECYMMRDIMLHGLGGNYVGLKQWHNLYSIGSREDGISKLRRGYHGAGSRWSGRGNAHNEHYPGKLHDDDGDWRRWIVAAVGVDGGWENQPWIPNAVIGETCNLETDATFKNYQHIQDKNQFRFIKTEYDGVVPVPVVSPDTPVPQADDTFSRGMAADGFNISSS